MSNSEISGTWNERKGELQQKFAYLTDNDVQYEEGKKEEMLGKIQVKLDNSKEELRKIIEGL